MPKKAIFKKVMKCLQMENINKPYTDTELQIHKNCICLYIKYINRYFLKKAKRKYGQLWT